MANDNKDDKNKNDNNKKSGGNAVLSAFGVDAINTAEKFLERTARPQAEAFVRSEWWQSTIQPLVSEYLAGKISDLTPFLAGAVQTGWEYAPLPPQIREAGGQVTSSYIMAFGEAIKNAKINNPNFKDGDVHKLAVDVVTNVTKKHLQVVKWLDQKQNELHDFHCTRAAQLQANGIAKLKDLTEQNMVALRDLAQKDPSRMPKHANCCGDGTGVVKIEITSAAASHDALTNTREDKVHLLAKLKGGMETWGDHFDLLVEWIRQDFPVPTIDETKKDDPAEKARHKKAMREHQEKVKEHSVHVYRYSEYCNSPINLEWLLLIAKKFPNDPADPTKEAIRISKWKKNLQELEESNPTAKVKSIIHGIADEVTDFAEEFTDEENGSKKPGLISRFISWFSSDF